MSMMIFYHGGREGLACARCMSLDILLISLLFNTFICKCSRYHLYASFIGKLLERAPQYEGDNIDKLNLNLHSPDADSADLYDMFSYPLTNQPQDYMRMNGRLVPVLPHHPHVSGLHGR